jgi:Stage II sporulation protein E (SpoIIE)
MKKTSRILSFFLLLLTFSVSLATSHAQKSASEAIALGKSAVALTGPWKFTIGDSPIDPATGKPLWADPAFDDSAWENVDLTPKSGAQNPINGIPDSVPGWTARGHAGYWGYGWYRVRLRIHSEPGTQFALEGPASVDDAYQVFANGSPIGHFGDFSSSNPGVYYAQPLMFPLPPATADSSGTSTIVIAFRIWMQPHTLLEGNFVGGFESAPLLGEASTITLVNQSQYNELFRAYLWQPLEVVVLGLLGLLAISLTLADRSDRVYLWIGGLLLVYAADAFSGTLATITTRVTSHFDVVFHEFILLSGGYACWVMIWRLWFRQRRPVWMPWALIPIVLVLIAANAVAENFFISLAGTRYVDIAVVVSLIMRLAIAAFLLFIVMKAIREQGIEGWLVLPAVLLSTTTQFAREIRSLGVAVVWFPFGVQINLTVASHLLFVLVLAILLVRRLVLSIRRQRLMALDVKQAQEVQQVILPEALVSVPGLAIESEYRPALEVGGDFFQIIPHPADGSVLIVAGDVAGKGLKAGMLVSLIVGAIRTAAESDPDPSTLLRILNRRLLGRGDARATCLALRIESDGRVTLANAGHMPPYLNDQELDLEGSLPLGLLEDLEPSTLSFDLRPNDRLLLLSDGVAEATDEKGALFGFDRIIELLHTKPTAARIALVAQSFGQCDDISVIAVTRLHVAQPALV